MRQGSTTPTSKKARVFQSGNSQAVRLPKEFRFRCWVVEIYRRGDEIVLRESPTNLEAAFDLLVGMSRDFFVEGHKEGLLQEERAKLKG